MLLSIQHRTRCFGQLDSLIMVRIWNCNCRYWGTWVFVLWSWWQTIQQNMLGSKVMVCRFPVGSHCYHLSQTKTGDTWKPNVWKWVTCMAWNLTANWMVMPVVLMIPILLLAHKPVFSCKIHKLCRTKQKRKGSVNFYTTSDGSKKIKESWF